MNIIGHQQTTGTMSAAQLAQLHQRQQQLQQLRLQQLQMDSTQKQQTMQQQVRYSLVLNLFKIYFGLLGCL